MENIKLDMSTARGTQIGTTGWLKEILSKAKIKIGTTQRTGAPCAFLCYKDSEEKYVSRLICFLGDPNEADGVKKSGNILYLHHDSHGDRDCHAVFDDIILTPSCSKAVRELVDQVVSMFEDWIEDDPEITIRVFEEEK